MASYDYFEKSKKESKTLTKTVVMSNDIFDSVFFARPELSLNTIQYKFIFYLISLVEADYKAFRTERFSLAEFCEMFNVCYKGGSSHKYVRDCLYELGCKKYLLHESDNVVRLVRWVKRLEYDSKTGEIEVCLDDSLKQYCLGLKNKFCIFQVGFIREFTSKYSFPVYAFLRSRLKMRKFYISIQDARRMFAYGKYKNFADFKKNVFDTALYDIQEYSDIYAAFDVLKTGVSYTSVTFNLIKKSEEEVLNIALWKCEQATQHNALLHHATQLTPFEYSSVGSDVYKVDHVIELYENDEAAAAEREAQEREAKVLKEEEKNKKKNTKTVVEKEEAKKEKILISYKKPILRGVENKMVLQGAEVNGRRRDVVDIVIERELQRRAEQEKNLPRFK